MSDSSQTHHTERDKEWAKRIQNGDRAAFESLFRSYAQPLCRFTEQYTESPEIAEDLVQDLFFKIWHERERWDPSVSVKSYLYASARNLALDYIKHEKVVDEWKSDNEQKGHLGLTRPDKRLHRKELRKAVRGAIEDLPERRREVFKMSRDHGLTYKEIASVMDITVSTVETQMRRAFRSIREALSLDESLSSDSE